MPHGLQVGKPNFLGFIVGVGNVMAVLRGFSANIANSGHFLFFASSKSGGAPALARQNPPLGQRPIRALKNS
jgi:hypothetical protein